MKYILRDNALEAWAFAIRSCDAIMDGKLTLAYRKQFVASLHNAVELFLKQYMLNVNDYRVAEIKKGVKPDGQPAKNFYESSNLNEYFSDPTNKDLKYFYSIEFQKLSDIGKKLFESYLIDKKKEIFCEGMKLLGELRNAETHFYIKRNDFLTDKEFVKLYNFMIIFYEILAKFRLLPFIGKVKKNMEHWCIYFVREELIDFTYEDTLKNAIFVKNLKNVIENKDFPSGCCGDAYGISYSIAIECTQYSDENFEELWTYVESLLRFNLLETKDVFEGGEFINEQGQLTSYCGALMQCSLKI